MRYELGEREPNMINRNMGCIEISLSDFQGAVLFRLIETWDVLK